MDTDTYRCVDEFIVDSGSGAGETPALPVARWIGKLRKKTEVLVSVTH